MTKDSDLSFEVLAGLENTIKSLENGEITLEESLQLFEKGVKLARLCSTMLNDYEKKIEVLLEKDGNFSVNLSTMKENKSMEKYLQEQAEIIEMALATKLPEATEMPGLFIKQCDIPAWAGVNVCELF